MRRLPALVAASIAWAAPMTEAEKRGQQLYRTGSSAAGRPVQAFLADNEPLPGSALPCANCHGLDGRGRPEGGITPSDISWEQLMRADGHRHEGGRAHGKFNVATVEALLESGIDPAGNRLPPGMPRYKMAPEDYADLISYWKRLGVDLDPGLTAKAIRLGVLVPRLSGMGPAAEAAMGIIRAMAAEVNSSGGVHGRTVAIAPVTVAGITPEQDTFGVLMALPTADPKVFAAMTDREIPMVAVQSLSQWDPAIASAFVLTSTLRTQVKTLIDTVVSPGAVTKAQVAVLRRGYPELRSAAADRCRQVNCEVLDWDLAGGGTPLEAAAQIKEKGLSTVLLLLPGDAEQAAVAREFSQWARPPALLLLSALSGRGAFDFPAALDGKLTVASPVVAGNQSPQASQEILRLEQKYKLPEGQRIAKSYAYAVTRVFLEGLQAAGRTLTRRGLVDALETLSAFDTRTTPPVSFGPGRRIGAMGAYLLKIDLARKTVDPRAPWVEVQ